MAIEDSVELRTRGEAKRVEINGVPMLGTGDSPGVLSLEWGDSYDQPPWLNVELNTIPSWMRAGMDVKLWAGINNDMPIQFTGFISALPGEEPEFLRDKIILDGAVITIGTEPDTSESALNATATLVGADIRPPLPAGSYIAGKYQNRMIWDSTRLSAVAQRILTDRGRVPGHPAGDIDSQTIECSGPLYNLVRQLEFEDTELDVGGMTDIAVIEQELARVGITDYIIDTPSLGAYTLADDATIDGGSGIDRLQDLVGIASPSGLQFHQTPGGTILLRELDFFPAPTAAFEYSTDDPLTAYITDTSGVTEIAVTFNPTIRKGMTGQFTIPHLNVDGRYFVYGVRHVMPRISPGATSAEGPTTYLRLRGGNRLGGTVAVNPVAAFTFSIRRQVVNDRVYLIYTLDGSDSVSLDGTITDWDWTISTGAALDPITTSPAHPLSGRVVTFMVDPADIDPDGILTSTLTVTASNTLTHATALELPNAATESAVVIAPFGVAGGIRRSITPDGGETYNNTTPSAKEATAIGARPADGVNSGHFAVGHDDGSIDVTRDFGVTWTAATFDIAPGSQINYIAWDWRATDLVWAITEECELYLSNDAAVSFFRLADFRTLTYGGFGGTTAGALGNLIGLPAGGGIYIFGGTGAGVPLIAFNTAPFSGGQWIRQTFTGDLLTDITTPADATMRIEDYTAPGDGMEHMILSWASGGGASLVAIYYTTSAPGAARAWSRATGLTAGLKTGRVILSDAPLAGQYLRHAMFADRDTWHTTDGIAWTQTTNVLPVGYTPNHGLFESDVLTGLIGMQDVFLIAAENAAGDGGIFKAVGNGMTVLDPIYGAGATYATPTYPAGEKPKQIAIGAVAQTVGGSARVALVKDSGGATSKDVSYLSGPSWTTVALPAGITQTRPRIYCLTTLDWLVVDTDGFPGLDDGDVAAAAVTHDGGATWASSAIGDEDLVSADKKRGIAHVCRAADGRWWGARCAGTTTAHPIRTHIYYSDDEGATWNAHANGTLSVGGDVRGPWRLIAHPTNPNIIALISVSGDPGSDQSVIVHYTDDRGATAWTTNDVVSGFLMGDDAIIGKQFAMLANNRIVATDNAASFGTPDTFCWTTDDFGVSWTLRQTIANTTHHAFMAGLGPSKIVLFRAASSVPSDTKSVWISTDQGQTYTQIDDTYPIVDAGNDWSAKYDPVTDSLTVVNNDITGAGRVMMFSPVVAGGVWNDITYNLPGTAAGPWDCLAVIP